MIPYKTPRDFSPFLTGRYTFFGLVAICLMLIASYITLVDIKLDSASIAYGKVSVEGNRKTVEHLEGGIVESVLVKEGDFIKTGQPLIVLAKTSALANVNQVEMRLLSILAQKERLVGEREGVEELYFTKKLIEASDEYAALKGILRTQRGLFTSRTSSRKSELAALSIRLQKSEIDGFNYAQQLKKEKLARNLLNEELEMHNELLAQGYTSEIKTIELKRNLARISADIIRLQGLQANTNLSVSEIKHQILTFQHDLNSSIESELQDLSRIIEELSAELSYLKDVLSRTTISSPYSGRVVGLKIYSKGDVVVPGEALMNIVPQDERLIVEAVLKPEDIDQVFNGQRTLVRLSAYNIRKVPLISGNIIHIAADRINTAESGVEDGYRIQVGFNIDELSEHPDMELYPGMPAEVLILLTKKAPIEYLLEPLHLGILRAFRE